MFTFYLQLLIKSISLLCSEEAFIQFPYCLFFYVALQNNCIILRAIVLRSPRWIWLLGVFLVAQMVKNLPTVQETWIQSLSLEDPQEKGNGYPFQYCLENSFHGQRSLAGYSPWGHSV